MRIILLSILTIIFMSCESNEVEPNDDHHNIIESSNFVGCWVSSGNYTSCINSRYELTYKEINLPVGVGELINDTLFYGQLTYVNRYWFIVVGNTLEYNYVGGTEDNVVYTIE